MFTFTELHFLISESVILKYSGYLLPLLLFLLTKHVWAQFSSKSKKISSQKEVIDVANINTDVDDGINDDEHKPHLEERDHVPYQGLVEFLDKSGEQFYRLANNRRSIRKFAKDKPVDFQIIKNCILAAGEIQIL